MSEQSLPLALAFPLRGSQLIEASAGTGKTFTISALYLRLILGHGFGALNLHRVYCGTSSENVPMQKLALAMGFSLEGRRREALYKNFGYLDVLEYGLLRREWQAASTGEASLS